MTGDQQPSGSDKKLSERLDIDFALQAAGLGVWELDPITNQVNWDDRCRALFGLAKDNKLPYEQAIQYIHPEDIDRVDSAVRRSMNPHSGGHYDMTYRTMGAEDHQLRWVRFIGRSYFNQAGEVTRFAGIAQDVTRDVETQLLVFSQKRFQSLVEQAPVAMAVFRGPDHVIEAANEACLQLWGRRAEQVLGKPLFEALPEAKGIGYEELLTNVLTTGEPFHAHELSAPLVRNGQLETVYFNFVYQPLRETDGSITAVTVVANEITEQVLARQKLEASEAKLRGLIAAAPAGIGLFVGRELIIENPNQTFIDIVGKGPGVEGLPLREAMPELLTEGQPFLNILDDVFTTGVPFTSPASLIKIVQNGVLTDNYYNISYTPVYNAAGEVYAILDIAIDVTAQVKARQALGESEAHLQLLRNTVPAMIFYLDAQQRYQSYNDTFMHWFGVGETEVIGKTVRKFLGEAAYQAVQPHLAIAYGGRPEQYESFAPTRMGDARWLNITYTPHQTPTGEVIGLIVHAADITLVKQSEAVLRDREAALRNAIELAELGTFSVDVATQVITVSPRVADWFGFGSLAADAESFIASVGENDRERVRTSLYNALLPDSDGRYDVVHSVVHAKTGRRRIIRALGRVYYDMQGRPVRVEGTAQDVTLERELQLALEQQVQRRTEELAASNEELQTTNEELLTTNEELTESTSLLVRSNDNLQQFAYIASHDLQEPLRKIQSFGDLLKEKFTDQLGEGVDYLNRMQAAAGRMSTLIRDLLAYSRIATHRDASALVSLNEVVNKVLTDLELMVVETNATIRVDPLPTLPGDALQLGQLFQNLLSNALKFRRREVAPVIDIRSSLVAADHLPEPVKPARSALMYHRIEVSDNGIGFDEKYLDRIFQVFQRLHGKSEITGTGIGLAICEKVVTNHGGAITAISRPEQGATFVVYLPD